jgi:hypothetical protein
MSVNPRKDYNEARDTMSARFHEFEAKYIALHADYPEFHVAFWNHCDFLEALESVQIDLHDAMTCDDVDDVMPAFEFRAPTDMTEFCTCMSNYLRDNYNAEHGVDWNVLKDAAASYLGEVI